MAFNLSPPARICKKSLLTVALFTATLLAPLQVSAEDMTSKALQQMQKKKWDSAYLLTQKAQNPLLNKLYQWERFQKEGENESFNRLSGFIDKNPDWPAISTIRRQLENSLLSGVPPAQIINWFQRNEPLTAEGFDRYAASVAALNQPDILKVMVGNWWATTSMSEQEQRTIYFKYNRFIPLEAHRRRFDRLLFNRQYTNARAVAKVLGKGYPELAEARIALAEQKPSVNNYINRVPPALQADPGLMYERLRWRRRNDLNLRAMEILYSPPAPDKIANPKSWWRERHIMIRRLLEGKKYHSAYLLASKHQQTEGFAFAQAEWLAGWLALRYMDKPAEAYQRFESLNSFVTTPVSKARAGYWAGRAAQALKAEALQAEWLARAARYQTVFYGQEAGRIIGQGQALKHAAPPTLLPADIQAFEQNELIRAAILYNQAGLDRRTSQFLWAFVKAEDSPKAYRYAAEKAAKLKRFHDVISIAKDATKRGLFLTLQSYPQMLPAMKNADKRVEWALLHALIRQESQFDPKAQSHAGARGLMQIMPATAKAVARKKGISHQTAWLTQRPAHNIALGSRYLADLLERYDGNYIMAIAAYNAGPGRVTRWIKTFGDPRSRSVDAMDWIELIPIYETRNYVQRVLEGVYVYRLLLKDKNHGAPTTLVYSN